MTVFIAWLIICFDGYTYAVLSYAIPQIMKEWRLTPVEAGSIVSYTFCGLMIGAAGFGMLGDIIGRKLPLMIGLFLFSAFTGLGYWAPNFATLCVLRFLAGLGMGGASPLTAALISEFVPAKVRAKAVTVVFMGLGAGGALGSVIAMTVLPRFGWRSLFLVEFASLLLIPVVYYVLPESVRFLAQKGLYDRAIAELRRIEKGAGVAAIKWTRESFVLPVYAKAGLKDLFKPNLALMTIFIWCTYFFNMIALYGLINWLPAVLMKAGHSVVRSYGYTFTLHSGTIFGTILLGYLMDRFGRKQALVPVLILGGIAVWLFGVATGSALYVVAAGAGFFLGASASGITVVAGESYPTRFRSTGTGWALTIGRLGAIAGPVVGGAIQMANFSFGQFFIVFAIPCFICAMLVMSYRVNVKGESLEVVTGKLTGAAEDRLAAG
jgi:AAHS family benzoate transporter-like MFS transporter